MFLSKILTHSCTNIHFTVEQNIFYRYCSQAFSTAEILKSHVNDPFKINGKKIIKISKKVNMLDLKTVNKN